MNLLAMHHFQTFLIPVERKHSTSLRGGNGRTYSWRAACIMVPLLPESKESLYYFILLDNKKALKFCSAFPLDTSRTQLHTNHSLHEETHDVGALI